VSTPPCGFVPWISATRQSSPIGNEAEAKKIFDTGYAMGVQDAENESMGVTNCQSMSMLCRDSGILINVSMRP